MGGIRTRWEVTKTRREVTRTSRFPGSRIQGRDQESGRVGEISNMFDIFPTHRPKVGNYNLT